MRLAGLRLQGLGLIAELGRFQNLFGWSETDARQKASVRVGRSPDAVARAAISERLDYLEGRLRAIEAGFEDLQRGTATTEEVKAELDRIVRKHERKQKKTARVVARGA